MGLILFLIKMDGKKDSTTPNIVNKYGSLQAYTSKHIYIPLQILQKIKQSV